MVLTQLELPYGCLTPRISNYVYKEIRRWALIWQLQSHINEGPREGSCYLGGLEWQHVLPVETYHLRKKNASLNKQLHNRRYCKDKPKCRNTETYVWLQTQEGGFFVTCVNCLLEAFLFSFPYFCLLLFLRQIGRWDVNHRHASSPLSPCLGWSLGDVLRS